jgi:cytochrome c biogenesis protein ResB
LKGFNSPVSAFQRALKGIKKHSTYLLASHTAMQDQTRSLLKKKGYEVRSTESLLMLAAAGARAAGSAVSHGKPEKT